MKKIVSLLMVVVMLFGMMTVLTACGTPKYPGAEIRVYLGESVFDFDPSDYYVSSNAEQILSLLYEPLFKLNKNGKLRKAAAKKYTVDEEERKITIELRETYWSDGIQVMASDYAYAWCERIINPDNPNPAAALFYEIEGVKEAVQGIGTVADVGIKTSGMTKLVITYCEGADYKNILKNLASVAASPVRRDIVESSASSWSKSASTIVTNGPFRLARYDMTSGEFELARNLGYHQIPTVKDYNNKVKPAVLYTTFNNGSNNVTVSYDDIKNKVTFVMTEAPLDMRADYEKKAKVADHTSTYTYVFNTSHPLLSNVNVRQALSLVIDREAIVEAITFGKAADGFLPDICGGKKDGIIATTANKAAALECLSRVDSALFEEYKHITLTVNNDPQSLKIAEMVKAAWVDIGFDVTINAVGSISHKVISSEDNPDDPDAGTYVTDSEIQYLIKEASYGNVMYDVIGIDWQMYSRDGVVGLQSLTSKTHGMGVYYETVTPDLLSNPDESVTPYKLVNRKNIAVWADARYDELVNNIYSSTKKKERKELINEAEAYLMEQMPVCPIIFNQNFAYKNWRISGLKFDGNGNLVFTKVKLLGFKKFLREE